MKTILTRCLVAFMLSCGALVNRSVVQAAIPPVQPAQRIAQSDIVVQVKIVAIVAKVVANDPGHNDDYLAKVLVEKSIKGKARRGQMLTVHYWHLRDRPGGWAGPVGQNVLPKSGQHGTLFLKRGASIRAPFELLQPNGWELK